MLWSLLVDAGPKLFRNVVSDVNVCPCFGYEPCEMFVFSWHVGKSVDYFVACFRMNAEYLAKNLVLLEHILSAYASGLLTRSILDRMFVL